VKVGNLQLQPQVPPQPQPALAPLLATPRSALVINSGAVHTRWMRWLAHCGQRIFGGFARWAKLMKRSKVLLHSSQRKT
jgi:hypothetical protein